MRTKKDPNYGMGIVTIVDPVAECVDRIGKALTSSRVKLPILPKAALQVIRLTNDPGVKAAEILAVIETDATLAAQLLAQARSPAYGLRQVDSLKAAAVRLGNNGLRDLVLLISMRMRVFHAPGFEPQVREIMRFAQVRSSLCKAVNRQSNDPSTQASMAALLGDLGMATSLMLLAQLPRGETPPTLSTAWRAAQESHESIGASVAKTWNLPGEIVSLIRHHHHVHVAKVANHTIATILMSGAVAEHLDLGLRGPDGIQLQEDKVEVNSARRLLGLNTDKMKRIVAQARGMDLDAII
ncbi:MAG: HD-like signal output (HDOD) protein [Cognaticolwellia sp.]|jgi:HD-like signal output (HDOD) protein